ncbi:MAG TPA: CoA transferase, partial [Gaiellaceae bacterium]
MTTAPAAALELAAAGAARICERHLAWLGLGTTEVETTIRWFGAEERAGAEHVVQAASGLMAVHGIDNRKPRRLGLEPASTAAGILAAQGVLAAEVGRLRGLPFESVETSVVDGALTYLRHHVAIASAGAAPPHDPVLTAPGPPFRTADGAWVELEMLRFPEWRAFWTSLGATEELDTAWSSFALRYLLGACPLPAALHGATRRRSLPELEAAAEAAGVAICRVRSSAEAIADAVHPGGPPWSLEPAPGRHPAAAAPSQDSGPLAGLRVVELASRLQGPLAGLLLRLLGADVVKVEPPGGDRGRGGSRLGRAAYLAYNAGKTPVELDYKSAAGRRELAELVAEADVFVHNSRPGRAEQGGFGYAALSRANPALVYAYASGWEGAKVAPSDIAGDFVVQAWAGCGELLAPEDEPPLPSRVTLVDVAGGLLACEAILAGLWLRMRTGRGFLVRTSLYRAALALQAGAAGRPRWGPLDRPLETADGYLAVAVDGDEMRRRFEAICGRAGAR